jgi:hypothetical protein
MAHILIVGRSLSGKTGLAKALGSAMRRRGEEVLALNPTCERGFTRRDEFGNAAAEWETHDAELFSREVARRINAAQKRRWLIIDEAHEFFDRGNSPNKWIGTRGRHNGLNLIVVTQRAAELNPTVRGQLGEVYLMACSLTDAAFLADLYGCKELAAATTLKPGEFYHRRGNELTKGAIFTSQ